MSWGWRTISPKWRGLWGGSTPGHLPLDYRSPNIQKVVVLLTDGDNRFHDNNDLDTSASDFTGYGRIETLIGSSSGSAAQRQEAGKTILDTRMLETCTAMKAQNVTIHTIIFGTAPSATTKLLFERCATSPAMYHYAPTNEDIAKVFRKIGGQLANLMIVE